MIVAIIYVCMRQWWWRSYTEAIYIGVGSGVDHILWRKWEQRSYTVASVLVANIYGGGGVDHIGGGDRMRDLVGELVHIQ